MDNPRTCPSRRWFAVTLVAAVLSVAVGYMAAWTGGRLPLANAAPAVQTAAPPAPGAAAKPQASRTGRPSSQPRPPTAPASEPAAYPPPKLLLETKAAAEKLQTRLGAGYNVISSAPFVVAGNMSRDQLLQYARGSVLRPAEVLWKSYFRTRGQEVITVLLFADERTYRSMAQKLFGDDDVSYYGYYRHQDRTLVMSIATGTGTLVHELTHALIVYDWPDVPLWFNEGLASLHEQCQIGERSIIGLPNWRLPGLQKAIEEGKLRSLAELTTRDDFYGPLRGLNYAQARYFCLYLQSRGLLEDFYREYKAASAQGEPATKVIEQVCGQRVPEVDESLKRYVMTLRFGQ